MVGRLLAVAILVCLPLSLCAQAAPEVHNSSNADRYQLYGGYSYQSNSFNGVPGHRQGLNGWEVAFATPHLWHALRFKLDTTQYRGNNYGAQQNAYYILGGGQYDHKIGRETIFGEALLGDIGINRYWGPNGIPGMTASFTTVLGGGLDTPINRHFAIRVKGGWVYQNFYLISTVPTTLNQAISYPGLPNFFGQVGTGLVWKF
jgi:hypothetical protein